MAFELSFPNAVDARRFRAVAARDVAAAPSFVLREERAEDVDAREALLDEAFGPARFLKTCERLRAGRVPARGLALVAEDEGSIVATLRLWSVNAGMGCAALLLGPLAVARSHRSLGLGATMMEEGLARAAARGHRAVILVGDAPYYARFGFDAALTEGLSLPGPVERERFLGLELIEGALRDARGLVSAAGARVAASPRRVARASARAA
ncbi:GNAT family N-acetyltransferase [Methylosinus sp. Sm6]|uniref:GNAT family N-acetyltransferase n=1 Tax=Methylosinus sp. Sm6 TaxID=2866948 RepID=UPI001C994082|nr:N-acetyltransferase [Methylosinus sp. Sm6]MBY6241306.1 N-acetyltransferase [Methylosinus sp. Sm6]